MPEFINSERFYISPESPLPGSGKEVEAKKSATEEIISTACSLSAKFLGVGGITSTKVAEVEAASLPPEGTPGIVSNDEIPFSGRQQEQASSDVKQASNEVHLFKRPRVMTRRDENGAATGKFESRPNPRDLLKNVEGIELKEDGGALQVNIDYQKFGKSRLSSAQITAVLDVVAR